MLKKTYSLIAVTLTVIALSAPSAYAGCRTAYLNQVSECSGGFFETQGCYQDANVEYFACIARAAIT